MALYLKGKTALSAMIVPSRRQLHEVFKPPVEKEFKPEGAINEQLVEKITVRVIEALKQRGAIK